MIYHCGRYNSYCQNTCQRCTQPCFINWTGNLIDRTETKEHVIALPGDKDKIKMKSSKKPGMVYFKCIGKPMFMLSNTI